VNELNEDVFFFCYHNDVYLLSNYSCFVFFKLGLDCMTVLLLISSLAQSAPHGACSVFVFVVSVA